MKPVTIGYDEKTDELVFLIQTRQTFTKSEFKRIGRFPLSEGKVMRRCIHCGVKLSGDGHHCEALRFKEDK